MTTLISAIGISKLYKIYDKPQDRLKELIRRNSVKYHKEFWALQNMNFVLKRGETIGIIGRNGSGKSTLLQILAGTLTPSTGHVERSGRIAALLELGSGFNPEFSGVDNIYLNASLHGLSKKETDNVLDDILSFADIGEFVYRPVKTYSSGMAVRLAFAVIANVSADILIVDEALAVGDAIFVQKCMRYIRKFKEENSMIFVSHDIGAVKAMCSSAIFLKNGQVSTQGDCRDVALEYLEYCNSVSSGNTSKSSRSESIRYNYRVAKRSEKYAGITVPANVAISATTQVFLDESAGWTSGVAELQSLEIFTDSAPQNGRVMAGEVSTIRITATAERELQGAILGFIVKDSLGQYLFGENTAYKETVIEHAPEQYNGFHYQADFRFYFPKLPQGEYVIMVSIAEGTLESHIQHHWLDDAATIAVENSDVQYGIVGIFTESVTLYKPSND